MQTKKDGSQSLGAVPQIQLSLLKRIAGSEAAPVATLAVSVWRDIDTALAPIVGHRGVTALFGRSLHLARAAYPWLGTVQEGVAGAINFTALQTTLSQETVANIVAANGALLEKFVDLLAQLIGVSLTERLLRPIVDIHSTGDAA